MTISEVTITPAFEYGTDRPCAVGRLVVRDDNSLRDCIVLALRYTDGEGEWFPTWVGPVDEAIHLPRGFRLPDEMLAALENAVSEVR